MQLPINSGASSGVLQFFIEFLRSAGERPPGRPSAPKVLIKQGASGNFSPVLYIRGGWMDIAVRAARIHQSAWQPRIMNIRAVPFDRRSNFLP
jgi:hypothetical protein